MALHDVSNSVVTGLPVLVLCWCTINFTSAAKQRLSHGDVRADKSGVALRKERRRCDCSGLFCLRLILRQTENYLEARTLRQFQARSFYVWCDDGCYQLVWQWKKSLFCSTPTDVGRTCVLSSTWLLKSSLLVWVSKHFVLTDPRPGVRSSWRYRGLVWVHAACEASAEELRPPQ